MTEKIITVLFVFINSIVATTGYAGIALLMAIESACIPLPSELIMPFAGYLVSTGAMKLVWVATAGAIGCNLGSLIAYEMGCYGGPLLVERYGRWILMGRRELDWADRFFQRWGYMAVFIARLLPVIRTFIALPAGVARMPRGKFHIYTFLGSWPWCFVLAYLGMKLGENWRSLGKYFHQFDALIGVLLIGGIAWVLWSHWQNRLRGKQWLERIFRWWPSPLYSVPPVVKSFFEPQGTQRYTGEIETSAVIFPPAAPTAKPPASTLRRISAGRRGKRSGRRSAFRRLLLRRITTRAPPRCRRKRESSARWKQSTDNESPPYGNCSTHPAC